mmetsp:Transcript_10557/g.39278  ORF Transcript_10557/g.39278 Transcript_10557/m.39278 type:complete len:786 (-) Transcript_10557:71-2428(-)|eukprot:CAMPEP_0117439930 /NCGR_PEP_ID=MMETSP0759-20121206/2815_1 /TAXON_ID=63605 /ORGANISM="Percolomonas cosmopolitus, Strain WS" /LENGTH=785 /DNA_ID=CAMNT_0005231653 /DNA_START=495 /DNA_END=2852 /DNA_ORIENTATION=-
MNTHPLQKRKRLTQQGKDSDAPNAKKRKVSEFESALENHDIRILKKQKQMIQKKYKEKVREAIRITKQLDSVEKDRDAHVEILAYIDQLWSELSEDVNHLSQRLGTKKNSTTSQEQSTFLSKLLATYKTYSDYTINNQKARAILTDKLTITKKLLSSFVEAYESSVKNQTGKPVDSIALQKTINESHLHLKKIEAEHAQCESKITILEKKTSDQNDQMSEIQTELNDAQAKIEKLEASLEESRQEVETVKRAKQTEQAESTTVLTGVPVTDEQTQQIIQGLQTDVHHLRSVIKMKEEELVEKSKECIQLIRDHEKALLEAQSPQAIEQTLPYRQLVDKCNVLNAKLNDYQKEVESAHDREHTATAKLTSFRAEILGETQKKLESLKTRLAERDSIIRNLKFEMDKNKDIAEKAKETTEYEKQIKTLKAKLESKSKKITRLRADIRECFSKDQTALVSKIKFLNKQKKIADKKAAEMETEVQNLRKRMEEEKQNPDAVSRQELETKVEELTKFKETMPGIDHVRKVEELTAELEEQKALCNEFEQELNELSHHCEELNLYKDKQAEQIRKFEDVQIEFNLERVREKKRQALQFQEREKLQEQINLLRQKNEKVQQEMQVLHYAKASQEKSYNLLQKQLQLEQKSVETQRHQQNEIAHAITAEKTQREALQMQLASKTEELTLNQQKYAELEEQYKHLEDESERLKIRLQNAMQGIGSDELREELDEYRKLVTCSICQTNQKSVLITRCHHTFCKDCIDRQVASRSRKCPTCGVNYSPHGDLTNFYL